MTPNCDNCAKKARCYMLIRDWTIQTDISYCVRFEPNEADRQKVNDIIRFLRGEQLG